MSKEALNRFAFTNGYANGVAVAMEDSVKNDNQFVE